MKKTVLAVAMMLASLGSYAQKQSMDEFVTDLMSKMTLEEKLGQLNQLSVGDWSTGNAVNSPVTAEVEKGRVGSVLNIKGVGKIRTLQELAVKKSRLHIPLLVGMDVIHGYETIFPIPLALAASWNPEAAETSARIAAKEATACGIDWTFSPMVDIALDARWGRIAEGNGEDPYLSSRMAEAMVRGYQGDFTSPENILACLKHFALYGAAEAGKEYNTVDMSHTRMFNQYLPPYEAAVKAGVGSVMTSFNIIDGIPATANKWMVTDILRNKWGFKGFVVTDYASVREMTTHGLGDDKTVAAMALKAGTDMEMVSECFIKTLEQSLKDGSVTMEEIDNACRRVLEAKYRLGLFKNPYIHCDTKRAKKDVYSAENRRIARDIAAETFVLLKNEGDLLPLQKKGRIALIGPLADEAEQMSGCWSPSRAPQKYRSLRQGMAEALAGKAELLYSQGCNFCSDAALEEAARYDKALKRGDNAQLNAEALRIARDADVIVCAMGETADMSGESASRVSLELPDTQMDLLKKLVALGKPVVLLNFSGRPTVMNWEKENVPAIMNVWFPGSEACDAIPNVLFGDKCPSGRLTVSMPQNVGQEPLYYNHLPTGRPVPDYTDKFHKYQSNYLDVRNDPAFPFGFGLSYTTFKYSAPRLSATTMSKTGSVKVMVSVTNTGNRDAYEVAQLYIHDPAARVSRPVKELKGFKRIHLNAGETKEVTFELNADLLKYYDSDCNHVIDDGIIEVMTGPNSRDLQKTTLTVM